jgi:hypothetical protein
MPESKSEELVNEQSEETQGAEEQSQDEKSSKFDPSKLTPDLQEQYKLMQADATKKWQAASEKAKTAEALEEKARGIISEYEEKLTSLNMPKSEADIDTSQMTAEQRQAWEIIKKDRQKDIKTALKERDDKDKQLVGIVAQMQLDYFLDKTPGAEKYLDKMREIQKQPGHQNLPLKSLYRLAVDEKELKQAGAEEYKASVTKKKKAVTTKPGSPAGEEADIEFNKGFNLTRAQKLENLTKAFKKGREDADKLRL